MKEGMLQAELPEPEFRLKGFFTASFCRPIEFDLWIVNWSKKLKAPLIKLLQAIHVNPSVTKEELMIIIEQGKTSVDNHIKNLKKEGLIKRSGGRKTGGLLIDYHYLSKRVGNKKVKLKNLFI